MNNVVEVKLDSSVSNMFFYNKKLKLNNNLTVIVNTDKGLQFGKIVKIFDDALDFENVILGDVIRVATKKDYYSYLDNKKKANEALDICKKMVIENNLDMSILDAYYNFDRTQLIFRFVSTERVDFRQLAKNLGAMFHSRIELRQIGIRDKAKEIGGIGPCGRLLCCTSFLKNFDSVTINMAKNQNVSLNPSKINGVCGRLLCCLKYENDYYTFIKKKMPKMGDEVIINGKKGRVVVINLLRHKYVVEMPDNKKIEVDVCEG